MESLIDLYRLAEKQDYNVYWYTFDDNRIESVSVMDTYGYCDIAIDPYKLYGLDDEYCKLAHEIGHCETGSFYNEYATCDVRQKHENRADKWAIEHKFSKEDLFTAMEEGYTELWSLAEYFGVTEDFMKKAVCWYTHGNLAVDLYF
jgi:hypothetical protein